MLQLFHANLETRHFSFDAYAYSEVEAFYIMKQAWLKHRKQTGATDTWANVECDVYVHEILVGAVYRDGQVIHRSAVKRVA